ncbi:MAG: transposase [bacterium]|nr:transposase [bacterium]
MANRKPIELEEWYHCYNRGVDKRKVFLNRSDYERFLLLMFIANASIPAHTFHLESRHLQTVLSDTLLNRGSAIVEIGAYSLMPNHIHFVLKEIQEGGISLFMQKVFTGYTMYFNERNERTGSLFAGTFKSKHVVNDDYLKLLVPYVHLNCVELFDPKWKAGQGNIGAVQKRLEEYPYSSLPDFLGTKRPERKLLGDSIFELFERLPTAREMLEEAKEYYRSLSTEV